MTRQAVHAAVWRATPAAAQCLGGSLNVSINVNRRAARAAFSTTAAQSEDRPSGRQRSEAAAQKIAMLGNKQMNAQSGQLESAGPMSRERPSQPRAKGPIDARALSATSKPLGSGGLVAPKILNLRSIRGMGGARFAGPGRGAGPGEQAGPGRTTRFGSGGFGVRGGRLGGAAGGRAGLGRSGGRPSGMRRTRSKGAKPRDEGGKDDEADRNWKKLTPEEKAIVDRLEKGEEVRFDPKLTLDSLSGYGAAIASDSPLGQVETAIREMRVMTGGMAFNADSGGVTADITAIMKRYEKKQPIFVHSTAEKEWIERAKPKHHLVGPKPEIKKAIIETAIRGKYEQPPGFAPIGDPKAAVANYVSRTFTYRATDSEKFMNKLASLLPAAAAGGKPASQAKQA